ncbi:MAG TPA: DUF4440 domain-containing protein [Rhodothermales bacterium]|nr:DUF4440 domain-containing protein [Rhodothermales bacterium]
MFFKQITGFLAATWTFRVTGVLLVVSLCATGCEVPQTSPTASFDAEQAEAAIRAVLTEQETAWNSGDIDAFMDGYARTDSLRFASGGTVQNGWQTTLDRYRRAYPDRAAMGTLSFTLHEVRVLSPRYALVFGAWQLDRAEDQPSGLFTLLFEHRPEGWRIIADHTSSAS